MNHTMLLYREDLVVSSAGLMSDSNRHLLLYSRFVFHVVCIFMDSSSHLSLFSVMLLKRLRNHTLKAMTT